MSATGRSDVREPNDNYPTPEWSTHRFQERARKRGIPLQGRMFEPMAGDGAIIRALASHPTLALAPDLVRWTACELRMACADRLSRLAHRIRIGDVFSSLENGTIDTGDNPFDISITNPSYALAMQLLMALMPISDWIVMLLRLNFMGSAKRHPFLSNNMPDLFELPNRPPFAKNKEGKVGTDATEYAWFVWGPHSRGATRGYHELLDITPDAELKRHLALLRGQLAIEAVPA